MMLPVLRLLDWYRGLRQRLHDWYRGKYVPPRPSTPYLAVISPGHYGQPAFAKLLRTVWRFWLDHWKWAIPTTLTFLGVLVALVALTIMKH